MLQIDITPAPHSLTSLKQPKKNHTPKITASKSLVGNIFIIKIFYGRWLMAFHVVVKAFHLNRDTKLFPTTRRIATAAAALFAFFLKLNSAQIV